MTTVRSATLDRNLHAVVISRTSLLYAGGSDASADRPAFVRAASSVAWVDDRIAVVQDDANFVALVDPANGDVRSVALPRGEAGFRHFDDRRGNKKYKLDLEACVTIPGDDGPLLLAFGSGSQRRRRKVATVDRWRGDSPRIRMTDATALYERLEAELAFAGSDMNVEGALFAAGAIRLFGRGNGAARRDLVPLNATCELPLDALLEYLRRPATFPTPEPCNVVQYTLGEYNGVALGFTDATSLGDSILYSAAAESSADASVDGPVSGSVLGVFSSLGRVRYTPLVDDAGRPLLDKVEGVVLSRTSATRAHLVVDHDDASRPSELCQVELIGSWGE